MTKKHHQPALEQTVHLLTSKLGVTILTVYSPKLSESNTWASHATFGPVLIENLESTGGRRAASGACGPRVAGCASLFYMWCCVVVVEDDDDDVDALDYYDYFDVVPMPRRRQKRMIAYPPRYSSDFVDSNEAFLVSCTFSAYRAFQKKRNPGFSFAITSVNVYRF